MMRFTGFVAFSLTALNCASFASGFRSQDLFGQDFLWVWYLLAVYWLAGGVLVLAQGIK